MTILMQTVDTPVGPLTVAAHAIADGNQQFDVAGARTDGAVVVVAFSDHFDRVSEPVRARLGQQEWVAGASRAGAAVAAYVAGDLAALDQIPIDVDGTAFQRRVWGSLRRIRVGHTATYAEVAASISHPRAVRAVGTANGANPVWLVVPCHRVVTSGGDLGGYAGGLDRKRWLLSHEGHRRFTSPPRLM